MAPRSTVAAARTAVFLLAAAVAANCQAQSGRATYVDLEASQSHVPLTCQLDAKISAALPAISISAAHLTHKQDSCARCILVTGTGVGIGAVPVATTPTRYLITHQCLDCAPHELEMDLPVKANIESAGQWAVSWSFVDCPSASDILAPSPSHAAASLAASVTGLIKQLAAFSRPQLNIEQAASHRRLAWASDMADSESFAETLPSAEWLEAALSDAGSEDQHVHALAKPGKLSRRQLNAQDSTVGQRQYSLRALRAAAASERSSQAQVLSQDSEDLPSAAWQAAVQAAAGSFRQPLTHNELIG